MCLLVNLHEFLDVGIHGSKSVVRGLLGNLLFTLRISHIQFNFLISFIYPHHPSFQNLLLMTGQDGRELVPIPFYLSVLHPADE